METRIKSFNTFVSDTIVSENLKYHIDNNYSLAESVFRPGSTAHLELLRESREQFFNGSLNLDTPDKTLFEQTDLGLTGIYEGEIVPLDLPLENLELHEEKKVKLNYPKRGGSKKYYVYVKNPDTGNIKKISFGDTTGLSAKVSNPEARKSFAARHKCSEKKDRTKAGYWACRINKYAHLWGGKTYPGFW